MTRVRKFKKTDTSRTTIYIHCQNPKCGKLVQTKSFYTQYCSRKCKKEAREMLTPKMVLANGV